MTSLVLSVLLIAVIVELMMHMAGQNAGARSTYTIAVMGGIVSLATLSALLILARAGAPGSGLHMLFNFVGRIGSLVIIVLVPCLFVIKHRRSLALEVNLTLIAILVGVYYLLDLVGSFIFFRSGPAEQYGVVQQALWLAYAIVFYWALARGPRAAQGSCVQTG